MVENRDPATRLADSAHFADDFHRIRNAVHDVGRIDDVEGVVSEFQRRGVHLYQTDVREALPPHAGARLLEHRRGKIDAGDAAVAWIERGVDAGADSNFEHAIAWRNADSLERDEPARMQNRAEDQVAP